MSLWPFFTYYGGKWRTAPRYPAPVHECIVEPFAGSAGYSVRHNAHKVHLIDADEAVAGVWEYLIRTSADEIRRLPLDVVDVRDLDVPQEARWLIGYWLNKGMTSPCLTPGAWMRGGIRPNSVWGEVIRERIAGQVDDIRHWRISHGDYRDIVSYRATWFVDPPYNNRAGLRYRHHAVDFVELAAWCRSLVGQVVVCEQVGATWLPFEPFLTAKASGLHAHSEEAIWTGTIAGRHFDQGVLDFGVAS